MELEDLEAERSRLQAEKDAHAAKVNRARCGYLGFPGVEKCKPEIANGIHVGAGNHVN